MFHWQHFCLPRNMISRAAWFVACTSEMGKSMLNKLLIRK